MDKAIAWRPQDQQDVERLLVLHGGAMALVRVRARVGELADALEVDRLTDLDALIARVLAAPVDSHFGSTYRTFSSPASLNAFSSDGRSPEHMMTSPCGASSVSMSIFTCDGETAATYLVRES